MFFYIMAYLEFFFKTLPLGIKPCQGRRTQKWNKKADYSPCTFLRILKINKCNFSFQVFLSPLKLVSYFCVCEHVCSHLFLVLEFSLLLIVLESHIFELFIYICFHFGISAPLYPYTSCFLSEHCSYINSV